MSKRIGVGVISLGRTDRPHARSYRALAERYQGLGAEVRLVAACDSVEAARDEVAAALGFERAYADYRELLADPEVGVVSICSPNFLHHEIVLTIVITGKPFWIEKPMGASAAQPRQIAEVADAVGPITAVGFNYRHTPAIERARQPIRNGRIGRATNVCCWLITDYGSSPEGPLTWHHSRGKGGSGVIGDLLSHGADLVQYLVGRTESVTATSAQFIPERPTPIEAGIGHSGWEVSDELDLVENKDWVAALVRLEGGAVATTEASRVAVGPRTEYATEVYGIDGSLRRNFEYLNDLFACVGRGQGFQRYTRVMASPDFPSFGIFRPGAGISMDFDDMKTVEAAQLIESMLTSEQLAPSVADGWTATEIDEAAAAPAADGRWHDAPEVTGHITWGS